MPEGSSISRESVPVRRNCCRFHHESSPCNQLATWSPVHHAWEWCHSGSWCQALQLASQILSRDCSQTSHEWKPRVLSPCIISIPVIMSTLYMRFLVMIGVAGERGWLESTNRYLSIWLLKPALLRLLSDVQSCRTQTPSHFFFPERAIHVVLFIKFSVTIFPIMFLPRPWPFSQTIGQTTWINM